MNSHLLLSCLSEAGKSSVFSSLDNLSQISATNHRYYKRNHQRKSSVQPLVTLSGRKVSSPPASHSELQVTRRDSLWAAAALNQKLTSAGSQAGHTVLTVIKDLTGNTWRRKTGPGPHRKVLVASKFVIVKLQLTGSIFVIWYTEFRNKLYCSQEPSLSFKVITNW